MEGEMDTEKVVLAIIYKKNGNIYLEYPNPNDVAQYELYGFLDCYLNRLRQSLIDGMVEI